MKIYIRTLVFLALLASLFGPGISQGQNIPSAPPVLPPSAQRPVPAPPAAPKPKQRLIDPIAKGHLELGKAYLYARNRDAAIENFRKAIERDSQWGEAYHLLGQALLENKSYKDAERSLRKALLDPGLAANADVYRLLGVIFEKQKNYKDAEVNFRKALDLDPRDPSKQNSLAYVYALQGKNLNEALKLISLAITATSDDHLLFFYLDTRAWIYFRMGKYLEAEKDAFRSTGLAAKLLKTSFLEGEDDAVKEAYYHLGEIYLRLNKTDLARREFQKALKLDGNYKEALEGLRKIP